MHLSLAHREQSAIAGVGAHGADIAGQRGLPERSPDNEVFLSVASLWEILVKHASGRFDMHVREAPDRSFVSRGEAHGVASLPMDEDTVAQLPKLPDLHRDPFDRILVCQAIAHGLTIVTPDEAIRRYPVRSFW
jgi:PIN domain nuclease of toxin-antitoxin system